MARSWPVVPVKQGIRRRWERLWQGECDPETLRSVPSWGLSVILHALMILLLAIIIRWTHQPDAPATSFVGSLIDTQLGDVTSLVDAKQAGDPFTMTNSPDPPSIGLDSDPQLKLVGQPEVPSLNHFAPAFAGP